MLLNKKNYKNIGYILCVIMFYCISCGIRRENDIYKKIPIGKLLSDTVLRQARQIIPNDHELIVLVDISNEWDDFSAHLLFYDSTLRLYASSFFPSDKIDSVKNNIIYAIAYDNRMKKQSLFRNDLPEAYHFNFYASENVNGSLNRSNKIVEGIGLESHDKKLTFYVRQSKDSFTGVGYKKSSVTDSSFFKQFTIRDTIEYPLTDIVFDFNRCIVKRKFIESNKLIWEEMIVINQSILLEIYHKIINKFRNRTN